MSIFEYRVVQPPTVGELEQSLKPLPRFGEAVINLTVVLIKDELSARRDKEDKEVPFPFSIDSITQSGTPHLIGHKSNDGSVFARLEVVDGEGKQDADRALRLVVSDPNL